MKAIVGGLLMAAAAGVYAEPVATTAGPSVARDQTDLIERFRYIETLDITAEKPTVPANRMEPVSAEIEDILEESEAAE
jgi:hypothetical protein